MKILEKIVTTETVEELYQKLKRKNTLQLGSPIYFLEKRKVNNSIYTSLNFLMIDFRNDEINIKKMNSYTKKKNFLAWLDYNDFKEYAELYDFKYNMSNYINTKHKC